MIPECERKEILANWKEHPAMQTVFSVRQSLEDEFIDYTKHSQLAVCPLNFISWLKGSPYAERFARYLVGGKI